MNIIISTVKRDPLFIHRTIRSIQQETSLSINLMIGGEDVSYLDKYQEGFIKHRVNEEGLSDRVKKASMGNYQALSLDRDQPALIIEDDVILKKNWATQLEQFTKYLGNKKYLIGFIVPFKDSVLRPNIDVPSLQEFQYNAKIIPNNPGQQPQVSTLTWANASAVYYSKELLQTKLPEFIKKFCVEGEGIYDLAIGEYCFRNNIPIYLMTPSMARNIGNTPLLTAMNTPEKRNHVDYSAWDDHESTNVSHEIDWEKIVREELQKISKDKIVLDLGGYDGKQAKIAKDSGATRAICVDDASWGIYDEWKAFDHLDGVEYLDMSFMDFKEEGDISIFQNVIYHQRNPWSVMEKVRSLTKETLLLTTSTIKGEDPIWRIYRPYEGHPKSWTVAWRPTINGLITLLEATGWKDVKILGRDVNAVVIKAKVGDLPIGFRRRS